MTEMELPPRRESPTPNGVMPNPDCDDCMAMDWPCFDCYTEAMDARASIARLVAELDYLATAAE